MQNTTTWEKVPSEPVLDKKDAMFTRSGQQRRSLIAQLVQMTPYYPALSAHGVTPSIESNILMVQLKYWFDKMFAESGKHYFYKFIEPAKNTYGYKPGDSWCEELALSPAQFRKAFDEIGIAYASKTAFDRKLKSNPDSIFKKKISTRVAKKDESGRVLKYETKTIVKEVYYASYHDRMRYRPYFVRNDKAIDAALHKIIVPNPETANLGRKQLRDNQRKENRENEMAAKEMQQLINDNPRQIGDPTSGNYNNHQYWKLDYQEINSQENTKSNGYIRGDSDTLSGSLLPTIGMNNEEFSLSEDQENSFLPVGPELGCQTKRRDGASQGAKARFSSKRLLRLAEDYFIDWGYKPEDSWMVKKSAVVTELFFLEFAKKRGEEHDLRRDDTLKVNIGNLQDFMYTYDSDPTEDREISLDGYRNMIQNYLQLWEDKGHYPSFDTFCKAEVIYLRYREAVGGYLGHA